MEIKDLKISAIKLSNESQFHAITDEGTKFFDINNITFKGKKYTDVNVLATDLKVSIVESLESDNKTDLSNIDIDSLTDEQMIKIATRLKALLG